MGLHTCNRLRALPCSAAAQPSSHLPHGAAVHRGSGSALLPAPCTLPSLTSFYSALCSDWAQCFVLELVTHYQPASEEERFDILEVRATKVVQPCATVDTCACLV